MLGAFCPQFLTAMSLACLFSRRSASLWRGGGGGLFLAYRVVFPIVGVSRALHVFMAGAVWAYVATTLNLKINFRSGFWVGCPLCYSPVGGVAW